MKIGPKYKICKRLGNGLYEKCQTQRFMLSEARSGKSRKGRRPRAMSDFGRQLLEKQKVRYNYGISEKQLSKYVTNATQKGGADTASILFTTLESRLDNVVYRMGFTNSRAFSRQMVSHGHITVNGRKVTIPSYAVTEGNIIGVREGSKSKILFSLVSDKLTDHTAPNWISLNKKTQSGEIKGHPAFEGESLPFDITAVLEYYSR